MPNTFSVGDILVYPSHGIVEVKQLERIEAAGQKMEMYVLETLEKKQVIKVPTKTAEATGLRRLFHYGDIEKVWDVLRSPGEQYDTPWYDRIRVNTARMKSGDLLEIAKIVRDLYFVKEVQEKNSPEGPLYKEANALFLNEVCYVEKRKKPEVQDRIKKLMKEKPVKLDSPSDSARATSGR